MMQERRASADPGGPVETDWKRQIHACFGEKELAFATGPGGESRAYHMLGELRRQAIDWNTAKAEIRRALAARGASEIQILRQLRRVEMRFRPWLADDPF